jgi:hypothetical protein
MGWTLQAEISTGAAHAWRARQALGGPAADPRRTRGGPAPDPRQTRGGPSADRRQNRARPSAERGRRESLGSASKKCAVGPQSRDRRPPSLRSRLRAPLPTEGDARPHRRPWSRPVAAWSARGRCWWDHPTPDDHPSNTALARARAGLGSGRSLPALHCLATQCRTSSATCRITDSTKLRRGVWIGCMTRCFPAERTLQPCLTCGSGLLSWLRPREAAEPLRDHRGAIGRFGRRVSGPSGTPPCSRTTGLAPSPRGDCIFWPSSSASERTAPRSHGCRPQAPHVEGAIPRRVHRAGPATTGLAPHDKVDALPQDEATVKRRVRSNAFNVAGAILANSH